jgi:hypothetical protein
MRVSALVALCGVVSGIASMPGLDVRAQAPAVKFDVQAAKGLPVSPVYEGWYQHKGTTYALFGYVNRNLEEVVNLPVGPDNKLEPGPADQGQPTRFFPGYHEGVFAVAVPKDRPKTEVAWTLNVNGQRLSIPAFLDQLYVVSPYQNRGGVFPGKTPPVLKFEPSGPPVQGPIGMVIDRTVGVARPLILDVWISDDGRRRVQSGEGSLPSVASGRPPQDLVVRWNVYRAPASSTARFSAQKPTLQQGRAQTTVTFTKPGNYMLHLVAIDTRSGTKCCWTNGYVRVAVESGGATGSSEGR